MPAKSRKLPPKPISPEDWPRLVRPGSRVFVGSYAAVPTQLVNGLLAQVSQLAAELKKAAKEQPGSSYFIDRRKD